MKASPAAQQKEWIWFATLIGVPEHKPLLLKETIAPDTDMTNGEDPLAAFRGIVHALAFAVLFAVVLWFAAWCARGLQ